MSLVTGESCTGTDKAATTERTVADAVVAALRARAIDATQPMYAMDSAGNLVFANRPFRNLLAVGHIRGGDDGAGASSTGGLTALEDIHAHVVRERAAVELEETAIGEPGGMVYVSRHFPVFDAHDTLIGLCGFYASRSPVEAALASAERTIQAQSDLLSTLADWSFETDATLAITSVSGGIQDTTGHDPMMVRGRYLLEVGRFESRGAEAVGAIRAHQPFRNLLFRMIGADGAARLFRLNAVPLTSGEVRFLGYRGTASLISEQEQAMMGADAARQEVEGALGELTRRIDALVVARDKAVSAREARDRFLATVSHELRTPLNAVMGFSEMCAGELFGTLPEPYLGYNRDILSAARHLMRLVDDLMDLAKIERDELKIEPEAVGAKSLLESTTAIVAFDAERKEIGLTTVEPKSSLVIWADPTRARQILVNLLNNAIKFTEPGGTIRLEAGSAGNQAIAFTVSDTGIGIAAEQQAGIFEAFRRANADEFDKAADGLGIGLHLARRLARLMDGEIELESTPGQGSRFTVRLPRATAEARAAPED